MIDFLNWFPCLFVFLPGEFFDYPSSCWGCSFFIGIVDRTVCPQQFIFFNYSNLFFKDFLIFILSLRSLAHCLLINCPPRILHFQNPILKFLCMILLTLFWAIKNWFKINKWYLILRLKYMYLNVIVYLSNRQDKTISYQRPFFNSLIAFIMSGRFTT